MRWSRSLLAVVVATSGLLAGPVAGQEGGRQTLPRLGDPASTMQVRGKIADSTRGKPGPVRLVVEKEEDGKELAVLIAPNVECDRLGLSLRAGETITVIGQLVGGTRPLLVAESVVVDDGRRVEVRSAPAPSPTP